MKKTALSFLLVLSLLTACSSAADNKTLSIIELVPEADEVLVHEKTDIQVKTDPENTQLEPSDFDLSGGTVEVNGENVFFSANENGSYTIKAVKDGIESNPVTIKVVSEADDSQSKTASAPSDSDASKTTGTQKNEDSQKPSEKADSSGSSSSKSEKPAASDSEQSRSQSDRASGQSSDQSQLTTDDVLSSPDQYLGKTIEVYGVIGQDDPYPTGSAQTADGTDLPILGTLDDHNGIPVYVSQGGSFSNENLVTGTLEKETIGNYNYVLKNARVIALDNGITTGMPDYKTGDPVSELPSEGTFQFTADDVIIRNGENGLGGAASGYVFDAGMTVHYDKVYQKDGYTWLGYTAKSGARHSVAAGNTETLLYGFPRIRPYE